MERFFFTSTLTFGPRSEPWRTSRKGTPGSTTCKAERADELLGFEAQERQRLYAPEGGGGHGGSGHDARGDTHAHVLGHDTRHDTDEQTTEAGVHAVVLEANAGLNSRHSETRSTTDSWSGYMDSQRRIRPWRRCRPQQRRRATITKTSQHRSPSRDRTRDKHVPSGHQ